MFRPKNKNKKQPKYNSRPKGGLCKEIRKIPKLGQMQKIPKMK